VSDPFPWLPPPVEGDPDDDPWADLDVPAVALTPAQHDFLAAFDQQPALPRVRGLGDPIARFEEQTGPAKNRPATGKPPDDEG
jgi:hypothetical protein